jgi:hypothetical protein
MQGAAYIGRRRPVVGASVFARREGEASHYYLTATDERGAFRIDDLPEGTYSVKIDRQGLAPVFKTGIEVRFPFRAVVEVLMQPVPGAAPVAAPEREPAAAAVDLAGEVRGSDGAPLSDVALALVHAAGGADPVRARTPEDGSFAFDDLVVGDWRLEVRGVGYLTLRADLPLRRDASLTVLLVPQPPSYEPAPLDLMPPERPIPPPGLGS